MDVIDTKINWFPGHMKKALDQIKDRTKLVDLFIEVVDSRCVTTSSNEELRKLANNKPILQIALKEDWSTLNKAQNANEYLLIGSIKNKAFKQTVIKKLYEILDDKFVSKRKKGLVNPKFLIMIVGLPNVGKSSLINLLKSKNTVVAQNKPGVTKNQRIVNINQHFDLIDTPGILFKKIDNYEAAFKLGLINCIKKEILPVEKVLEFGFNYLKENNLDELLQYYKIDSADNYYEFVEKVCRTRQYLISNEELDINRFEDTVYNDFTLCKIANVNYDK